MDEIPGFGQQSQIGSVLSWKKVQGLKEGPHRHCQLPMMSMDCEGGLQLLQGFILKQEKLPHRGPLKGPDADSLELRLAFDECCIWLNKPSKVQKPLRFICIFICLFSPFFCIFICIFSSIFMHYFEIPSNKSHF